LPRITTVPWMKQRVAALFVDTGAFYAAADQSDEHHTEAAATFQARPTTDFITTDHVIVETWMLIRGHLGWSAAMRFWNGMDSGVVKIVGVTSADFVHARRIAHDWEDQEFSMVDCTSFAAMQRLRLVQAFSFDEHFHIYRYGPARRTQFRVIP
jgi:uncharacterized protein